MFSPWRIPLPLTEYSSFRVVIYYFWNNQWVPIKYCTLSKAIQLAYEGQSLNQELFLFPVDLNPNNFNVSVDEDLDIGSSASSFRRNERLSPTKF